MKATNKLLGTIAMLAAPFLFLQMAVGNKDNDYNTSLSGFFDLIYMIGWMCSTIGLLRLQATGSKKSGNALLQVQLAFLCLANLWNIWVIFDPTNKSSLFFVLDMFWPLSNLCLLVVGIVTAVTGKLRGWRRYVVLITGMWLPVALSSLMIFGRNNTSLFIGGIYSTIAWFTLGWMIYTSHTAEQKQAALSV
jgi:hypothetical protein